MKLASVVGARPQFIKEAAVSRAIVRHNERGGPHIDEVLIHTGQHYDFEMSAIFFRDLDLPEPQHHLGIGSGPHGRQTAAMLADVEEVLLEEKPDAVLVYGDTNSTLAGALAAAKLHIPVGHVEAGLRSFNRKMAEEVNRVVTDHLSTWLFTPSGVATKNLAEEGITQGVCEVGDVMFDVLRWQEARLEERDGSDNYILVTIHRAENTDNDDRLRSIAAALAEVAQENDVVFPVHPRTANALQRLGAPLGSVRIVDPVGYREMVQLERGASAIVTDSGGVQKEAYWLGVPCLTLRDETEWTETVDEGWNRLIEVGRGALLEAVRTLQTPGSERTAYGSAAAADEIVSIIGTVGS